MTANHSQNNPTHKLRKIIHVDMDCFYAAVEIRDNPSLANQPVAVGGPSDQRGVLCTCNYVARQYGLRSAMPTATAFRYCPQLVLLPVNIAKYKAVARRIHDIFREFTDLVEPLSLDEAYLDVSACQQYQNSATWIAEAIRKRIQQEENLTASAGVATNKFLAKIASGWNKPNGLCVIKPEETIAFVNQLTVDNLFGVGKVTAEKLHRLGLNTCLDLQRCSLSELSDHFGKFGLRLYEQCRGLDERPVEAHHERKSLSVERTFLRNINHVNNCENIINELHAEIQERLRKVAADRKIKNQYVKIKFHDFKLTTAEASSQELSIARYQQLFREAYARDGKPIRLLGVGVHFTEQDKPQTWVQEKLF